MSQDNRIEALKIAAGVFAQVVTGYEKETKGGVSSQQRAKHRTIEVFKETVDAIFKAAKIGKVDWGSGSE